MINQGARARKHNLRTSSRLPRERLIVSPACRYGKSSLAFDNLYAGASVATWRRFGLLAPVSADHGKARLDRRRSVPAISIYRRRPATIAFKRGHGHRNPRIPAMMFARVGDPYVRTTKSACSAKRFEDGRHVLELRDTRLMILAPDRGRGRAARCVEDLERRASCGPHDGEVTPRQAAQARQTKNTRRSRSGPPKVRPEESNAWPESFETALRHSDGRALAARWIRREHLSRRGCLPVCSYSLPS